MMGEAVLVLWLDVDPARERECDEWYLGEHIPDRIHLPGFRRARRYRALQGAPEYLAIYEAQDAASMLAEGYLGLLENVNDTGLRMRAAFRNTVRSTFAVGASVGLGEGGAMASLRFAPAPGAGTALRRWITGSLIPELARQHCVCGAHFLESVPAIRSKMDEYRKTGLDDASADWVILFEAPRKSDIDDARNTVLPPGTLARQGAAPAEDYGVYDLLYGVAP